MNWRMAFAVATLVTLYGFLGATNWHPMEAFAMCGGAPVTLSNNSEISR